MDPKFNLQKREPGTEMLQFLNSSDKEDDAGQHVQNVLQMKDNAGDMEEDIRNLQRATAGAGAGMTPRNKPIPAKEKCKDLTREDLIAKMESQCRLGGDAYLQEVHRAIYGGTVGHPTSGSAAYFQAAQEYALFGCDGLVTAAMDPDSYRGGSNNASGSNIRITSRFFPNISIEPTAASMASNIPRRVGTPRILREAGERNAAGRNAAPGNNARNSSGKRSSVATGAVPKFVPPGFEDKPPSISAAVKKDNLASGGSTQFPAGGKQRHLNKIFTQLEEVAPSKHSQQPEEAVTDSINTSDNNTQ